jgi:hypothetical protein
VKPALRKNEMKRAPLRQAAVLLLWLCSGGLAGAFTLPDDPFANSAEPFLTLAPDVPNVPEESFAGVPAAFAALPSSAAPTPAGVFENLSVSLHSRTFLENRMQAIQLEALNNLPGAVPLNTPIPEPSSLITGLLCGCGVLLGLQRLRRRRT